MRKKAITKPEFRKIFIVRFIICLLIFSAVAGYALGNIHDKTVRSQIYDYANLYRNRIYEETKMLSEAKPGSKEYKEILSRLKAQLAYYQMTGKNYVEVKIGDFRIATEKDTAVFHISREDGKEGLDFYLIDDISYLDPLNDYLKKNGKKDEKEYLSDWYRYGRDPFVEQFMPYFADRGEDLKSVYLNREDHTFIPGVIVFYEKDKRTEIDCTPADTKGYEYVEFAPGKERYLIPSYRIGAELSSKDVFYHTVPVVGGAHISYYDEQLSLYEDDNIQFDDTWHIGYYDCKREGFFEIIPVTTVIIMLTDLAMAVVVALVLAKIKYEKEKAIWEIFDYRVKTTEAMAHDLKTPLSTIMFYLENLEQDSEDPGKVLEYKNNINDKVVMMDHMIGDILQFSKGESGNVTLNKEKVSLKEIITGALKEFPEMKTEIQGDDVTLTTDKKYFSQVIMNLLSNCDRYGRKDSVAVIKIAPGSLTISNKTDRTYDDVDSLKKPFVKGDDSRGNKGTGLGLAIADNNLAMLGYKLELSSKSDEFSAVIKFKS